MKREERLLRALGNVKDSFVLEVSQYMDDPRKEVLVKPKKKKRKGIAGLAAAAALVLTGALSLNLLMNHPSQSDLPALSNMLKISNMTVRRVTFVTSQTQNPRPIQQVQVSLGDNVVQTIDQSSLPDYVQGYNEGMFLSAVDIDDLPSDIPSCNQGLFFADVDGRNVRSDVDFRDVNFDGYADLGLAAVNGYPENLPYNYFLWNPTSEQFEYGFTLYGGAALEVDENRRLLIEHTIGNGEEFLSYYCFPSGYLCAVTQEMLEQFETWPTFTIQCDTQRLSMGLGLGGLNITPENVNQKDIVNQITIEFLPGLFPYAAMEQSRRLFADDQTAIHQDQETGVYSFYYEHNSQAIEVFIHSAGSFGTYRITAMYGVNDSWGGIFREICDSFTCPLSESPNPEAEKAIMDFAEGYFSGNRITMLANYYGDSQDLRDVYPQDASRVQIVSLQGLEGLDEWGHVSLTFLETEESDSYTYLSMEVMKTQAGYRVSFYGLEK